MNDPSKILKKAHELSESRDISAKRDAFAYFTIYSALTGDKEEAEEFAKSLLGEEKKAGKKDPKYMLFRDELGSRTKEEQAEKLERLFKEVLGDEDRSILNRILTDPLRSVSAAAYEPRLAEYIQKEFNCPKDAAYALALFLPEWQVRIRDTRDYLLGRKKNI